MDSLDVLEELKRIRLDQELEPLSLDEDFFIILSKEDDFASKGDLHPLLQKVWVKTERARHGFNIDWFNNKIS